MAPVKRTSLAGGKETLRHFTHPHVLIKELTLDPTVYSTNRFGCDGCGMDGSGVRYHCKQCAFDLHEECATCPEYLTSNFHLHKLERIWEGPADDYDLLRPCHVCGDQVKGLFYKCSSGADDKSYDDEDHYFFIHPTCSKLPSQVVLKLQSVPIIPDAPCAVCRYIISSSSWSYRSDPPCSLNVHPQCVTLPHDNHQAGSGASRSALQQVEDAAADEEELAAVMYAAKMRAKTNKFIINNIR
ncbi:uncharacterized protein LOC113288897 [Papaver somniferum]|uniref:uncharacterized protein LOC113288897 n=1 Tax=Papaver somniferum TaxID=3469 RepID=UPI000E6FAC25|nr:uncharacterized protein LOC113288897 [Papaver somniferum]